MATQVPTAEEWLVQGQPAEALKQLQAQVRTNASDVRLRIFLFPLLAVLGQWTRALQQLKVCGELDAGTLAMVNTYGPALQCEAVREAVFAGQTTAHVFGPPSQWVALLVQALSLQAQGHVDQAADLRASAFEQAPAVAGLADGQAFAWIADADSRLGPLIEVIINGRYGWLPFEHLRTLTIEPVVDLRDLVWVPAHLTFGNGGDTVALLPVRYVSSAADSAASGDGALQLARRTEWAALATDQWRGLGQRQLVTDTAEHALLELRELQFETHGDL